MNSLYKLGFIVRRTTFTHVSIPTRAHVSPLIAIVALLFAVDAQSTPIIYSETVNGELPYIYAGTGALRPVLNLGVGQNTVSGQLSSPYDFDTFAFNVPQSTQINSISLTFSQSTAIGYPQWGISAGATFGLSSGVGLPYAPYPNGNFAQTVYFDRNVSPTVLFPLAMPLGAGTYTVGNFVNSSFSGGYENYTYSLNLQSLAPPPVPVDPGLAFLESFRTAQSTVTQFQPGASLSQEEVIRNRDLVRDVQARRAAIELQYQQTTTAIWTDFWLDVYGYSMTSFAALGCVATGGVPCAVKVGGTYVAKKLLVGSTQVVLCERGDVNCDLAVRLAYFKVNPTFEAFDFDLTYQASPDLDYLLDDLNVGDTIGLTFPLFGDTDTFTLVTLANIEGSNVTLHFDGVRQVVKSVPEPSALALLGLGLAGLAAARRRKQ